MSHPCKRTSSSRPPWSLSWRRFFVLQISNYLINLSANNATLDFNLSAVMHKLPFLQTLQHLIESTLLCTILPYKLDLLKVLCIAQYYSKLDFLKVHCFAHCCNVTTNCAVIFTCYPASIDKDKSYLTYTKRQPDD